MSRSSVSCRVLLLATLFAAACSGSSSAPSPNPTPDPPAPPPAAPTVTRVAVASTQLSATTYQLRADAQMSDGTSRDVTSGAHWQTSNGAIAQVSQTGLVTALHSGTVEVRATYNNVTGTTSLTVAIPLYEIHGIVTEAPSSTPLEGVRINISGGPNQSIFTYSDDRGRFTLSGLQPGTVDLAVNRQGYQPWTRRVTVDGDITNLSVVLTPVPSTIQAR